MNKAIVSKNGKEWLVIFGKEFRGEFIVSHVKVSKAYKSLAMANKAKKSWEV